MKHLLIYLHVCLLMDSVNKLQAELAKIFVEG